ncbi:MAG: histone deacetylase [Candidatus Lindowbacteria bacterium]|nr:histone deacetylase [Candidatus Lindowbacteria bacterium]
MTRTAFVYHSIYQEHQTGPGHPERPERLTAILKAIQEANLDKTLINIAPSECAREHIAVVHTSRLIESIERSSGPYLNHVDPDTVVSQKSFEAALFAAGAGTAAADAIMLGKVDNAFCAVRPPGHHAESDRAMGFCLFNNVAIAARYLQRVHKIAKVLIIDWDVHHGNGTQEIFYDDPSVLYFSSHQYPHYPGTGSMQEGGIGKGESFTVNAPLRAGCGDKEYQQVYTKMLPPIAEVFKPDFVMVSAGFDAHKDDPLASMRLTEEGFAWLTQTAVDIAQKYCNGRLISMLEGGYDLRALGASVVAHLEVLYGQRRVSVQNTGQS